MRHLAGLTKDTSSPEADAGCSELVLAELHFAIHSAILARISGQRLIAKPMAASPQFEPEVPVELSIGVLVRWTSRAFNLLTGGPEDFKTLSDGNNENRPHSRLSHGMRRPSTRVPRPH